MSEQATNPQEESDQQRIVKVVKSAITGMIEHVDSVHVFITKVNDDGTTMAFSHGSGDWYARYGTVKDWVVRKEHETRREVDHAEDE